MSFHPGTVPDRAAAAVTPDSVIPDSRALPAGLPELAGQLRGRLATPSDADWDAARTAWNLAVDQRPVAVAFPQDADDVATVVRFAATHALRVAPQSGGHNPAPLGDLSRTILLRTVELRELSVDAPARIVRCGAGVLWGEVASVLAPHGLAALAGSSSDVGVSGYTLSGGYSWLSRRYGLAAGRVRSAELVTGDGRVIHVTATTEPDLFWALRGGGGNAVVVTALEFDVLPLEQVYAGSLLFDLDRAAQVCAAFAAWTADLDESATVCLRLLHLPPSPGLPEFLRGKAFVGVDGAIDADPEAAAALLAPLRELRPTIDTFGPMPAAELGTIHLDPPTPVPGAGVGLILDELTPSAIDALLTVAGPQSRTALWRWTCDCSAAHWAARPRARERLICYPASTWCTASASLGSRRPGKPSTAICERWPGPWRPGHMPAPTPASTSPAAMPIGSTHRRRCSGSARSHGTSIPQG